MRSVVLPILLLALSGCGAEGGPARAPALGTISLVNETDQGSLPLTVHQLFIQPAGLPETPVNLLQESVAPGGVVIVGQFAEGQYDALAVVDGNLQWAQNGIVVVRGQPTTLRLRFD